MVGVSLEGLTRLRLEMSGLPLSPTVLKRLTGAPFLKETNGRLQVFLPCATV